MKILALADTQIGAGASLTSDRLADQERMLGQVADLADEHDVDLVLHCGDVFEHRQPSNDARLVFKRWLARISERHPVVVIAGNHDLSTGDGSAAVDLYDHCDFVRHPRVLDLGGASLACLPWTPPGRLVAAAGGGDRDELDLLAARLLEQTASDLRVQCPSDKPAILALHWWLTGATSSTGAGEGVIHEPVLDVAVFTEQEWDHVVAGHVHRGQFVGLTAGYCGSPWVCSWGEVGDAHGVWLIDTVSGDWEHLPLADRPFVTVDVDLDAPAEENVMDETGTLAWYLHGRDLRDAVLRVRYRATEEQHRRIDHAALHRLVEDAGVHRLHGGFHWEPVRSQRSRVEGIDEALDHADAVAAWCAANDVDEARADGLVALTREWLAVGEAVTA